MQTTLFTEDDIQRLLKAFYARVRVDAKLGPVFAQRVPNTDAAWETHIAHIGDFWSSIFLKSGRYTGNPLLKHTSLSGIAPEHFQHWLALFSDTAMKVLDEPKHVAITEMAERIAKSLQMGLAFHLEKAGVEDHAFSEFGLRRRNQEI